MKLSSRFCVQANPRRQDCVLVGGLRFQVWGGQLKAYRGFQQGP